MNIFPIPADFEEFRAQAKRLLAQKIPPSEISFVGHENSLSFGSLSTPLKVEESSPIFSISKQRLRWMNLISLYRSDDTWNLLYRLLWKLNINKGALENPVDPDVIIAERRAKQVSRDIHKMHAFVRFHKTILQGEEYFVAWHSPQHKTLRASVPFFQRRFGSMRWSILTPDESAHWDLNSLTFSPGVINQPHFNDDFEDHWLTYYSSIFNPARIKIKAMKKEMPVRYWQSMPETKLIATLLEQAPARIEKMKEVAQPRAAVPLHTNLAELQLASQKCKACPIACLGGNPVFGEGPSSARILFVGEQPGDEEDLDGKPFVGPAGRLLDEIMEQCGIDRRSIYVTNAVKHFKWIRRGKRRIHQRPNGAEILACKPWLNAEIALLAPSIIICLGATAAQSVLGLKVSVGKELSSEFSGPNGARVLVTYHPSAALRAPTPEKRVEIIDSLHETITRVLNLLFLF